MRRDLTAQPYSVPPRASRFGWVPLHYSVSLEPDLLSNLATTQFRGAVVQELAVVQFHQSLQTAAYLFPLNIRALEIRQVSEMDSR